MKKSLVFCVIFVMFVSGLQAQSWQPKTNMPTPRFNICSVVFNNRIYVIGGRNGSGTVLDIVEVYDPQTDSWDTNFPALKKARENAAAAVFNGKIFVLGGRSDEDEILKKVEFFDLQGNRWKDFRDLDEEREGPAALELSGHFYALGGFGGSEGNPHLLNSVEKYLPNDDKWQISQNWVLNFAKASFATAKINDAVYVIGGFSSFGPLNLVQVYTEAAGASPVGGLLTARGGLSAAVFNGKIVVAGGRGADDQVLNSVELYDPDLKFWVEELPLTIAREQFAMETVNGNVYVIGGSSANGSVLSSVESADTFGVLTSVETPDPQQPLKFTLEQNYPNPFNAGTVIRFTANGKDQSPVSLSIYNIKGQLVKQFLYQSSAGEFQVRWDGTDNHGASVVSGLYVYTLSQGDRRQSKRMLFLK